MSEIRIHGRTFTVHDSGGEGPAVLWIHAFPLSGEMFRHQSSTPHLRHIVPDLPGFGHSRESEPFDSIDDMADGLFELMTQMGIVRFVAAGVSMGGYVAQAMLRGSSSDRLRGLILLDTRETADSEEARENRFRQIATIESSGTQTLVDDMIGKLLASSASDELRREVKAMMAQASPRGVATALRMMAARPDSRQALVDASIPALLVFGEEDAITPPSEGERMLRLNSRFRLVRVPDAGHLACLEAPTIVNREIAAFLGDVHR